MSSPLIRVIDPESGAQFLFPATLPEEQIRAAIEQELGRRRAAAPKTGLLGAAVGAYEGLMPIPPPEILPETVRGWAEALGKTAETLAGALAFDPKAMKEVGEAARTVFLDPARQLAEQVAATGEPIGPSDPRAMTAIPLVGPIFGIPAEMTKAGEYARAAGFAAAAMIPVGPARARRPAALVPRESAVLEALRAEFLKREGARVPLEHPTRAGLAPTIATIPPEYEAAFMRSAEVSPDLKAHLSGKEMGGLPGAPGRAYGPGGRPDLQRRALRDIHEAWEAVFARPGEAPPVVPAGRPGEGPPVVPAAPAGQAGFVRVSPSPFFSQMSKALGEKLPGAGPPDQMLAAVRAFQRKGLFKAEELKWSGLEEYLSGRTGRVTRQEILDHVAEHALKVGEIELSEAPPAVARLAEQRTKRVRRTYAARIADVAGDLVKAKEKESKLIDELAKKWPVPWMTPRDIGQVLDAATAGPEPAVTGALATVVNNLALAHNQPPGATMTAIKDAIWHRHPYSDIRRLIAETASAGREASRLHDVVTALQSGMENELNRLSFFPPKPKFKGILPGGGGRYRELMITLPDYPGGHYGAGHWAKELPGENVLASALIDERRIGPDRTLMIHEIQSDWWIERRLEEIDVAKGVRVDILPEPPFRGKWPEPMMKRLIRYAAERGYDRIAWSDSKAVRDRYNRTTYGVGRLEYDYRAEVLRAWREGDIAVPLLEKKMTLAELPGFLGRELADKLTRAPAEEGRRILTGHGMEVGGEWARNLYDRQMVSIANDLGKKFGTKVERAKMSVKEKLGMPGRPGVFRVVDAVHDVWMMKITPEMQRTALEVGFPLYEVLLPAAVGAAAALTAGKPKREESAARGRTVPATPAARGRPVQIPPPPP